MSRIAASIFGALGILLTTPALPQGVPPQSAAPVSVATQYLSSRLSAGMTLANYLQSLRNDFEQLDADGDGVITAADVELHGAVARAVMLGMEAQQIMSMDLNGDGVVTEDEVRRVLRYRQRMQAASQAANPRPGVVPQTPNPEGLSEDQRFEQEVRKAMAADTTKKGRITWEDALASVRARPGYAQMAGPGLAQRTRQLLAVAGEGRNSIALAEVLAKGEAFFRAVDMDGNGVISLDELRAYQRSLSENSTQLAREQERRRAEEIRVAKETEAQAACAVPKPSDAAKVILLGAYETEALSDTTIGSQDVAIGAGGLVVEPGDEPLYVVVTSFRPTIWRLSGAAARVERLVLTATAESAGPSSFVGATGLAADRVSFPPRNCIGSFWEDPSTQSAAAAANVRRDTGKQPAIYAKYTVGDFVIPSGQIRAQGNDRPTLVIEQGAGGLTIEGNPNVIVRSGPADLASELRRFHPGGVLTIDPATVVASRPAEKYQVLPYQAGLIQLLQSGALKRDRSGEFLIQEKIRFPAGLYGGYSVKFLLLRGVPKPDGNPGHSTVISEETGRPVEFR